MADLAPPLFFIGPGDLYLHIQMLSYYGAALVLGLGLGYLIWGWGRSRALAAAKAEGVRAAERKTDAEGTAGEIGRLKAELEICTKARMTLEERLEQGQSVLRAETPLPPEPDPTPEPDPIPELDPAPEAPAPDPLVADPEPLQLVDETPPDAPEPPADDLKQIKGIGAKLEAKLNANGISRFAQIAAWTADDIAAMDAELNFKGRITRDDWVAQAKRLTE